MIDRRRSLERNLELIPVHNALSSAAVWLPIFVLFTRSRFGIDGAVLLASMTYLFIVVLEVPSGWMSDRFGRVPTLTVAAAAWVVAHTCFLIGNDRFLLIVAGQLFISTGFAFISGTDVSFHYDSLEALGRADEYAARQARVAAIGYVAVAVSAVAGGLLGLIDLRLAFAAALVLAVFQLGLTRLLHEPATKSQGEMFLRQVGTCLRYLSDGYLGWLFFYGIALVTLEHVAATLMQPWLTEMLGREPDELGATPLLSGILFAVVAGFGAVAAGRSAIAAARFGPVSTLIGLGVLSAVIVTGMAVSYAAAILLLMMLRSVQSAAAPVIISAEVAPRTQPHHRATLLSINSLAGRLGYGLLLLFLGVDEGDDVQPILRILATISWVLVGVLMISGSVAVRRIRPA